MLVTLKQAKHHLRIDEDMDEGDEDILLKIQQVSALVRKFLKVEDDAWQDSSGNPVGVPYHASAAALVWLGILYKDRDSIEENLQLGEIPRAVSNILWMWRDPSYA